MKKIKSSEIIDLLKNLDCPESTIDIKKWLDNTATLEKKFCCIVDIFRDLKF
tara:strand:+ start:463 stop:618 length:156 start_codon:yes stop_codon:yes gene_type:complete